MRHAIFDSGAHQVRHVPQRPVKAFLWGHNRPGICCRFDVQLLRSYRSRTYTPPHPSSGFRETPDDTFPSRGRLWYGWQQYCLPPRGEGLCTDERGGFGGFHRSRSRSAGAQCAPRRNRGPRDCVGAHIMRPQQVSVPGDAPIRLRYPPSWRIALHKFRQPNTQRSACVFGLSLNHAPTVRDRLRWF